MKRVLGWQRVLGSEMQSVFMLLSHANLVTIVLTQ